MLETLLDMTPGMRVAGSFASAEEALAEMDWSQADILLADLELPGKSGPEMIREAACSWSPRGGACRKKERSDSMMLPLPAPSRPDGHIAALHPVEDNTKDAGLVPYGSTSYTKTKKLDRRGKI